MSLSSVSEAIRDFLQGNENSLSGLSGLLSGFGESFLFDHKGDIYSKINYDNIIGLPPKEWFFYKEPSSLPHISETETEAGKDVEAKILQSMLVLFIEPGMPEPGGKSGNSMEAFTFSASKGSAEYKEILNTFSNIIQNKNLFSGVGSVSGESLKVAVLADFQISESWSNTYSDMFLEGMLQTANSTIRDLTYIAGIRDANEAVASIKSLFSEPAGAAGEWIKSLPYVGNLFDKAGNMIPDLANNKVVGGLADAVKKTMNLLTGSQIDYPMIWRESSYSPQYSFTIRLYNPYPGDNKSYMKYIVDPLIYMISIMCPISVDNFSFKWPFMVRIKCPGLFECTGFISSMDIIKGGENNDISFVQRPNIIDIRFSVSPIYSTMISQRAKDKQGTFNDRPTVDKYIQNIMGWTEPPIVSFSEKNPKTIQPFIFITDGTNGGGYIKTGDSLFNPENTYNTKINRNIAGNHIKNFNWDKEEKESDIFIDYNTTKSRLSISELESSTDPTINSSAYLALKNSYFNGSENFLINSIGNLKEELTDKNVIKRQRIITTAEILARRLKAGLPIDNIELNNWFWNNLYNFPANIQSLVSNIKPPTKNSGTISTSNTLLYDNIVLIDEF